MSLQTNGTDDIPTQPATGIFITASLYLVSCCADEDQETESGLITSELWFPSNWLSVNTSACLFINVPIKEGKKAPNLATYSQIWQIQHLTETKSSTDKFIDSC